MELDRVDCEGECRVFDVCIVFFLIVLWVRFEFGVVGVLEEVVDADRFGG